MTDQDEAVFTVTNPEQRAFTLHLKGRNCWAMKELLRAGSDGCTPINNPAPRWSAYIHNLRKFGVAIETITERHDGGYPGNHARYILQAQVEGGGI